MDVIKQSPRDMACVVAGVVSGILLGSYSLSTLPDRQFSSAATPQISPPTNLRAAASLDIRQLPHFLADIGAITGWADLYIPQAYPSLRKAQWVMGDAARIFSPDEPSGDIPALPDTGAIVRLSF